MWDWIRKQLGFESIALRLNEIDRTLDMMNREQRRLNNKVVRKPQRYGQVERERARNQSEKY